MDFLLFTTQIIAIDWSSPIIIIIGLIGSIITIITPLWFLGKKILKTSTKGEKKKIESLLMHPDEVKPIDIMGDRGEKKYGYREDSWYVREDLENALINSVQSSNSYVTVITGHFASGKSRLAYHYITSDDCRFDWVYAPKTSITKIDVILNTIKSSFFKAEDTLLVLDDIDELYRDNADKDLGLGELMRQIHHKKIKTIITVTEGTYRFDDFKENCNRGTLNSYLQNEGTQLDIKFIKIKDIEREDDCHKWCIAELKDDGFSTVIGGYVPELSREVPTNIGLLSSNDKKALVTHYVSTKFRRHEGKEKELMRALHQQLWPEIGTKTDGNTTFDKSLGHLVKIGFLNKTVDENDRIFYRIGSQRLYHAFIARCVIIHDNENELEKKLRLYTQHTADGEQQQIDCYLNIKTAQLEERAQNYSRLISHSVFDSSIEHIWTRMQKEFNLSSDSAPDPLYQPIGDIIRRKDNGLELAKDLIDNKIIEPREIIISNLLSRTRDRAQATEYIKTLPHPIQINDAESIFYLKCLELASPDFDGNRVKRAQLLYEKELRNNPTDSHLVKTDYFRYCESLLKKAITGNRIDEFWKRLTEDWKVQLLLGKKSLMRFFDAIGANNLNGIKDGIILNAYQKLCDNWEHIVFYDESEKNVPESSNMFKLMTQLAITKCENLDTACGIYEYFKTKTDLIDHQIANRVTYPIFRKIKKYKGNLDRVRKVLVERIQSEESPERCHKMINTYLNQMSTLTMINSEIDEIKKASDWQGGELIDRDTINVMLTVLRDSIHIGKGLNEDQIKKDINAIVDMQERHDFNPTAHFNTLIYSCAQELIQKNASTGLIEKVRTFAKSDISNKDTINQEEKLVFDISERARIPSIIDINEAINVTENCIKYIEDKRTLHPDIIANIIQMYFNSFKSQNNARVQELKEKINNLFGRFDKIVKTPNYPYCKQKLRFMISEQQLDINDIINYIEDYYQQLVKMGYSMDHKNQDFYLSAIYDSHVSVSDAYELLKAAAKHPDLDKDSAAYDPYTYYFKASLISTFMKKLQKSNPDVETFKDYLKRIQDLINKHPHLSYIQDAGKISKAITDFGIYDMGIDFPITSRYASLRHEIWDNYAGKQELYKLDETTIKRFIDQEKKGNQLGKNPSRNYYIEQAQKELDSRKNTVNQTKEDSGKVDMPQEEEQ